MKNYILIGNGYNPHENLAIEEALAESLQAGDMALYLWQNKNTVVIGRNQNAWRECKCEVLRNEGGVLARRTSGGGAVYHDIGNLNFTFAASPERYDLRGQLEVVREALRQFGIESQFSGRNDIIAADGRKFSGNAFRHTKAYSMQHGTLLVDVDMEKLGRYLNPSVEKLKAKGVASVRSRVCNLREFSSALTVESLRAALIDSMQNRYGAAELKRVQELDYAEKAKIFASWAWNYGETPAFDMELRRRFDWGMVEILLSLRHAEIENARVYSDAMDVDFPRKLENALTGRKFDHTLPEAANAWQDIASWLQEALPL